MSDPDRWAALEVRHLRALAAVVDEGSFGAAARALGYTQSGVSQQIFALEQIAGATVLTRHPGGRRPLELTPFGSLMLGHARALLARVSVTHADLEALLAGTTGQLSVIAFASIGARLLPPALAGFREQWPGVQIRIADALSIDAVVGAIERGQAEVGLATLPLEPGPFQIRRLGSDPYVLVSSSAAPRQRLEDLAGERLLGMRHCRYDTLLEQGLLTRGIHPAAVERFDDNGFMHALVCAGEGVAVVPSLTFDLDDERLTAHTLPDFEPRELVAVTHAERPQSPGVAGFLEELARVSAQRTY